MTIPAELEAIVLACLESTGASRTIAVARQ
jgi:hypothetical protein